MSELRAMSAAELADELQRYGELPAAVSLVSVTGDVLGVFRDLRVELSTDGTGARFVAVTGYEPDDEPEEIQAGG
jgi:hypothetical protein